jgi:tetratricopeptide (TPR) repeat protein
MAGISTTLNDATAWKIQGNINYKQGNFEYALIFYENGLKLDPDNVDILNNKGMTLVKMGRIDEARQCQKEIRQIKERHPESAPDGSEKPGSCSVKIKGTSDTADAPRHKAVFTPSGFTDKSLIGELHIRDIEQNIELITRGIEKVRRCRMKETTDCRLRIKEIEENIELTKQGLEMVKLSRIEEGKKIESIEKNLELTRNSLDMIKLGRMKETAYYNQQMKVIEERIETTRRSIQGKAIRPGAGTTAGTTIAAGNKEPRAEIPSPVIPATIKNELKSIPHYPDTGDKAGDPPDDYHPVTPNRVVFAIVIVIVVFVLFLTYFNFF